MSIAFENAVKDTLNSEKTLSDNGAVMYKNHGGEHNALLNINFKVSSLRGADVSEIERNFAAAYAEDPTLALRWFGYAMDIRKGLGERKITKAIISWLIENHPDEARGLIGLVPEFGRWDMLFEYIGTPLEEEALIFIAKQLTNDFSNVRNSNGEAVSLLAKWMPSVNCHSEKSRKLARFFCKKLKLDQKKYRKMLAEIRKHLKVVECDMSAGRWGEINYEAVPSKANINYGKAFAKHDSARRNEFIEKVKNGDAKINSSVNTPFDIINKYVNESGVNDTFEELWKALPNYVQNDSKTICVVDTSGSMFGCYTHRNGFEPIRLAIAMGLYFCERTDGEFKNKMITFSRNPSFIDMTNLANDSIYSKYNYVRRNMLNENTDIEKTFDLILNAAVSHGLKQEDIPDRVLIISDMQFDMARRANCWNSAEEIQTEKALFESIAEKYKSHGYKMPKLVFWNASSDSSNTVIPIQKNDNGLVTVSGFSPSIMKCVLSDKLEPFDAIADVICSERYDGFGNLKKAND